MEDLKPYSRQWTDPTTGVKYRYDPRVSNPPRKAPEERIILGYSLCKSRGAPPSTTGIPPLFRRAYVPHRNQSKHRR